MDSISPRAVKAGVLGLALVGALAVVWFQKTYAARGHHHHHLERSSPSPCCGSETSATTSKSGEKEAQPVAYSCHTSPPDPVLTAALERLSQVNSSPLKIGRALDVACGGGRHSTWLADRGWQVTGVDRDLDALSFADHHSKKHGKNRGLQLQLQVVHADLERPFSEQEFAIPPSSYELIVVWMYWVEELLLSIAEGVTPNGVVAMAGKSNGRFGTSLDKMRKGFPNSLWEEIESGENEVRCYLIVRRK